MGDRANVCMRFQRKGHDPREVWLYTHWGGWDLPLTVQRALAKRWRWSDDSYLARIIFCEMVGDHAKAETGFGISPWMNDNEHPIIVIEAPFSGTPKISFCRPPSDGDPCPGKAIRSWSFVDYIALAEGELRKTWEAVGHKI